MVIEIPLSKQGKNKGKYVAIVDDCDADLLLMRWNVEINPTNVYARQGGKKSRIRMHRLILQRIIYPLVLEEHEYPDHINGNGLDNRRENLRISSHSQNMSNRKIQSNNTSGIPGVAWHKTKEKWHAYIKHNGKQHTIGYFEFLEDACQLRQEAELHFHGEFVRAKA